MRTSLGRVTEVPLAAGALLPSARRPLVLCDGRPAARHRASRTVVAIRRAQNREPPVAGANLTRSAGRGTGTGTSVLHVRVPGGRGDARTRCGASAPRAPAAARPRP